VRVIAGKYRSRPLKSLAGRDIRPTSDRLRETLFNVLCAGNAMALEGSVWLDLFAGTGAVGIEALSRGAREVIFVEISAKAARLIENNLDSLGMKRGFEVLNLDSAAAIAKLQARGKAIDFVFLDPPYRRQEVYRRILLMLAESCLVASATRIIAEHDRKFDPGDECGTLRRYRKIEQAGGALSFYRPASEVVS
jgi:16S rRNA (guanine966-N2)-methyltransferase